MQQDPHELTKLFFAKLETLSPPPVAASGGAGVSQLISGREIHLTRCVNCGRENIHSSVSSGIDVPIVNHSSLDSALAAYFADELLENENAYYCDRCHRRGTAVRCTRIGGKPAPILLLQLLRTSYDKRTMQRVKLKVFNFLFLFVLIESFY